MARHPRAVAALALMVLIGLCLYVFDRHYRFFDMVIYHDAIQWWRRGGDLYAYAAPVRGGLGFTYPPFAALALTPVALVPAQVAGWCNVAAGVAALTAGLAAVMPPHWPRAAVAVAVPLALATEPVRQTLGLGQINLWLFALIVLDLVVLRRRGSAWTGAGIGLATAIKLTPGLFIVYLLVTGQWRAARTATVTAAALTGLGLLVAPGETVRYFGDLLWRTGRVGAADAVANQSLAGLLARTALAPDDWWLPLCLVALVAGLHRARLAHAAGDEPAALTLTGLTANLISPMSWTHHLVFLPVAVLLLAGSRQWAAAAVIYAFLVLSPIWYAGAAVLRDTFTSMLIVLVAALPRQVPADRPIEAVPAPAGR